MLGSDIVDQRGTNLTMPCLVQKSQINGGPILLILWHAWSRHHRSRKVEQTYSYPPWFEHHRGPCLLWHAWFRHHNVHGGSNSLWHAWSRHHRSKKEDQTYNTLLGSDTTDQRMIKLIMACLVQIP